LQRVRDHRRKAGDCRPRDHQSGGNAGRHEHGALGYLKRDDIKSRGAKRALNGNLPTTDRGTRKQQRRQVQSDQAHQTDAAGEDQADGHPCRTTERCRQVLQHWRDDAIGVRIFGGEDAVRR
jgi:hypothetical protein